MCGCGNGFISWSAVGCDRLILFLTKITKERFAGRCIGTFILEIHVADYYYCGYDFSVTGFGVTFCFPFMLRKERCLDTEM
jgi:hypothetical protein